MNAVSVEIYLFKTSVNTKREATILTTFLDTAFQAGNWNFDLADCDKILRIKSDKEVSDIAIKLLQRYGFECEALID